MKDAIAAKVKEDEDVLFSWSLITVALTQEEMDQLLNDIINIWINLRGFALASLFVEQYKETVQKNTIKSKGLRRQLLGDKEGH